MGLEGELEATTASLSAYFIISKQVVATSKAQLADLGLEPVILVIFSLAAFTAAAFVLRLLALNRIMLI